MTISVWMQEPDYVAHIYVWSYNRPLKETKAVSKLSH